MTLGDVLKEAMEAQADETACYFCERTGQFKRTKFTLAGHLLTEVACPACKGLISHEKYFAKQQEAKIKILRPPRRVKIR